MPQTLYVIQHFFLLRPRKNNIAPSKPKLEHLPSTSFGQKYCRLSRHLTKLSYMNQRFHYKLESNQQYHSWNLFSHKKVLNEIYLNLHGTSSIKIKCSSYFLRFHLTSLRSCNMSMLVLRYFSLFYRRQTLVPNNPPKI